MSHSPKDPQFFFFVFALFLDFWIIGVQTLHFSFFFESFNTVICRSMIYSIFESYHKRISITDLSTSGGSKMKIWKVRLRWIDQNTEMNCFLSANQHRRTISRQLVWFIFTSPQVSSPHNWISSDLIHFDRIIRFWRTHLSEHNVVNTRTSFCDKIPYR